MRKGNAMKRRNSIISAILVLAFWFTGIISANAQIFLMEEDFNSNRAPAPSGTGGFVLPDLPGEHDSTLDWSPVGNGVWLLCGFGAVFALFKKKKED